MPHSLANTDELQSTTLGFIMPAIYHSEHLKVVPVPQSLGKYYWGKFPIKMPELEVATPTRRAFSGHGGHALTWRSHGHSLAA